ncbi:MAG: hypothetical protein J6A94_10595 [Lachnospiraceae bacterium]|nr:hypothetical protein [Lachnospiraceae bacterium]
MIFYKPDLQTCKLFRAPKRIPEEQYSLPEGEQYVPYHPAIEKCRQEMLATPYEEVYISAFDGTRLFYYFMEMMTDSFPAK